MERISDQIALFYLTEDDLLTINRYMILRFGGRYAHACDNIHNPPSFYHVLEAVKARVFETELYAGVYKKAAAYAFFIINDHVFCDGNKRTGCEAAFIFLASNGINMSDGLDKDAIVNLGLDIESGTMNLEAIAEWLCANSSETQ